MQRRHPSKAALNQKLLPTRRGAPLVTHCFALHLRTLIEAISDGVSNVSAQICFVHDLKNVRALRYGNINIARAAGSAALPFIGQGYSVRSAITSIVPGASVSNSPDDGTFCSALVAAAFRAAGAPEFAAIDPMKTTPAALEKAGHFFDVTSQVFVRILSPNNIEEMSALDGNRILSPLAGQAKLFSSYYSIISPQINNFIGTHPRLANHKPISFLECLAFIDATSLVIADLPHTPETEHIRETLRLIDDLAYDLLVEGELQKMLKAAQLNDEESMRYSISESFKVKPDINLADTIGLITVTKEQIVARSEILVARRGKSRAWEAWIEISREIIESLRTRLAVLEEVLARAFPGKG